MYRNLDPMPENEANRPCTLLVDNGSHRAQSTLNLRKVAAALTAEVDHPVHPAIPETAYLKAVFAVVNPAAS